MDEIYLLLTDVDEKQSNFSAKIKSLDKGKKTVQTEFLKMTQDYFKVSDKKLLKMLRVDYFD